MKLRTRPRGVLPVGVVVCIAALMLAASASAEITILDGGTGAKKGEIQKGKCGVSGKKGKKEFSSIAESPNGWELHVYIYPGHWQGFKHDYELHYGSREVGFDLYAPDNELFSNQFPVPGSPPGMIGGAIRFGNHGKRMSIGFSPAPNRNYTKSVSFAGGMDCKYRRR
jgi:hypothetical protein